MLTGIVEAPRPAESAGWQVPVLAHTDILDLTSDVDSPRLAAFLPPKLNEDAQTGADDRAASNERASSSGGSGACLPQRSLFTASSNGGLCGIMQDAGWICSTDSQSCIAFNPFGESPVVSLYSPQPNAHHCTGEGGNRFLRGGCPFNPNADCAINVELNGPAADV